jgi:hypothetical protein
MKNNILKNKKYIWIIFIIAVILGLALFWFEIRPIKLIEECTNNARERAYDTFKTIQEKDYMARYDYFYKRCIREKGLAN